MTILANHRLSEQRNPLGGQAQISKWAIYIGYAYWAGIFLLLGSSLPFAFESSHSGTEPYHVLNKYILFILMADYLMRWFQPFSAMSLHQYLTLPVKRSLVIHTFLAAKLLTWANLFWNFFFVPFAFITITKFYGFTGMLGYLIGTTLLICMNSQFSLLVHMMKEQKFIYSFLIPVPIYAICILWNEFAPEPWSLGHYCVDMGEGFIEWNLLYFLPVFALMALLYWLNMKIARKLCYVQPNNASPRKKKKVAVYTESKSESREFLRLEWKQLWRNKQPRMQFYFWIFFAAVCPLMQGEIEGESSSIGKEYFYTAYGIFFLGLGQLTAAISYAGNYIDGLMIHKSYLNKILLAKYRLQCLFSLIGAIVGSISIAIIFSREVDFIRILSMLFFIIGPVFLLFMASAIYTNYTQPLNGNILSNGGKKQNWVQTFLILPALIFYPLFISLLQLIVSPAISYWIVITIGLIVVLFHQKWISYIYERFMAMKYERLEKLRETNAS